MLTGHRTPSFYWATYLLWLMMVIHLACVLQPMVSYA
jgi:hypothetical protein